MAKINHLEMGADVLALQDVQVKKGFINLTVKLIYQPTNSVIKIKRERIFYRGWKKSLRTSSVQPRKD